MKDFSQTAAFCLPTVVATMAMSFAASAQTAAQRRGVLGWRWVRPVALKRSQGLLAATDIVNEMAGLNKSFGASVTSARTNHQQTFRGVQRMKIASYAWFSSVAAVAALTLLTSGQVQAATPFNTGVSASNVPLGVGSVDPHWTVISGPGVTAPFSAVVSLTEGLYADPTDAAWIWTRAEAFSGVNSPYTFRTTFTLSATEASNVMLSGAWAVDNFGDIRLNGANPVGSGALTLEGVAFENFDRLNAFSITGGFVEGINTLDFVVTDTGGSAGLVVSGLAVAPIPEASTLSMFAVGLAGALLVSRRRSRQAAA